MHKFASIAVMLVLALALSLPAYAQDEIKAWKIDSVTIAKDRNGADYVRFIVTEQRSLNGVKYDRSVPVMAFGETVKKAKTMKAGQTLKAVVSKRIFQERESYTILSLL